MIGSGSVKPQLAGDTHQITQTLGPRFLADIEAMGLDRAHREVQPTGNVLVREAAADEAQDLDFASRQPEARGRLGGNPPLVEGQPRETLREIGATPIAA